jgi:uncharacterized protein YyaL (SSP411 family)
LWRNSDADDDVVYTGYNAQWIRALAHAGGRLQNAAWLARAAAALDTLLATMRAPNDVMFHFRRGDAAPQLDFLLSDAADTARACLAVAQATGNGRYVDEARSLIAAIERGFWAESGGFWDRLKGADEFGALRYRDKPFEPNAAVARVLNELAAATGERRYHALAERVMAVLSAQAGRYGVAGACYALAVDEFFEPPLQIVVTGSGPQADALRNAALALPVVPRNVWSLPQGGRIGHISFSLQAEPAAYIAASRGTSPPVHQPDRLLEALALLR